MTDGPFYVVETSGYAIAPGGKSRSRVLEHELHVVGPNGDRAYVHVLRPAERMRDPLGRDPATNAIVTPAAWRAAARAKADTICDRLNHEWLAA